MRNLVVFSELTPPARTHAFVCFFGEEAVEIILLSTGTMCFVLFCFFQFTIALSWKFETGTFTFLLVAALQSSLGLLAQRKRKKAIKISFDPSPSSPLLSPLPVELVNILQLSPLVMPSPCCLSRFALFAALSVQKAGVKMSASRRPPPPPPPFLTSVLSSLYPALKKNNITKFPNVYSRVRNSSSSTPVVVDVSQTWQASLYYLPFLFSPPCPFCALLILSH